MPTKLCVSRDDEVIRVNFWTHDKDGKMLSGSHTDLTEEAAEALRDQLNQVLKSE